METLAKMRPAFKKDGTVTAGNASGINDAAAFLVLADAAKAAAGGHKPIARLVAYAIAGVPNDVMGEGPIPSTKVALQKAGLTLDKMDVIESNEAFAVQSITVAKGLGLDPAKTNANGGAIAIGHPVGATGAVIVTKLLHEMIRVNGQATAWRRCASAAARASRRSGNASESLRLPMNKGPPSHLGGPLCFGCRPVRTDFRQAVFA